MASVPTVRYSVVNLVTLRYGVVNISYHDDAQLVAHLEFEPGLYNNHQMKVLIQPQCEHALWSKGLHVCLSICNGFETKLI